MGNYAAIDPADGSGMNLLSLETRDWEPSLTRFISQGGAGGVQHPSNQAGQDSLRKKLGDVDATGRMAQGVVSQWFMERYGFRSGKKKEEKKKREYHYKVTCLLSSADTFFYKTHRRESDHLHRR